MNLDTLTTPARHTISAAQSLAHEMEHAELLPLHVLAAMLNDRDNVFHAVTSLHDVHPYAHVIAGANNSGRLSIWRA